MKLGKKYIGNGSTFDATVTLQQPMLLSYIILLLLFIKKEAPLTGLSRVQRPVIL